MWGSPGDILLVPIPIRRVPRPYHVELNRQRSLLLPLHTGANFGLLLFYTFFKKIAVFGKREKYSKLIIFGNGAFCRLLVEAGAVVMIKLRIHLVYKYSPGTLNPHTCLLYCFLPPAMIVAFQKTVSSLISNFTDLFLSKPNLLPR